MPHSPRSNNCLTTLETGADLRGRLAKLLDDGIILARIGPASARKATEWIASASPDLERIAQMVELVGPVECKRPIATPVAIADDPPDLPGPADRTWLHPDSLAPVSAAQDAVDHLFDLISEGVILSRLGPHADTLADRLARSTEPDPGQVRLLIALAGPVAWPFSAPDGVSLETSGGVA